MRGIFLLGDTRPDVLGCGGGDFGVFGRSILDKEVSRELGGFKSFLQGIVSNATY